MAEVNKMTLTRKEEEDFIHSARADDIICRDLYIYLCPALEGELSHMNTDVYLITHGDK